jgi:hypothetical protein
MRAAVEKLIERLRVRYGQVKVTESDEDRIPRFEENKNGALWTPHTAKEAAE